MRPVTVTVVGVGNSPPIPLDQYLTPFQVSLQVVDIAGAVDMTVEYTNDDVFAVGYDPNTGNWFPHTDLTNQAGLAVGTIISPVSAVRLVNGDVGTAQLIVRQAGLL